MSPFDLANKHIAITGASSGLGYYFAGLLAANGAKVTLGARRVEKLEEKVSEIRAAGGTATALRLDVRNSDSIEAFIGAAADAQGPIDVLINNAGVEAGSKTYTMIDEEDWDFVMDTNVKGAWVASKAYTKHVESGNAAGGNIVMVSSISDRRANRGQFPYAISKGALTRMTEVMALEAARYRIRVNALAPGYVFTDMNRSVLESQQFESFRLRIPRRRYGELEDLVGPLLLLVSDASRYMTGSVLTVDGGHVCASL
jgi:NAD(P)-dependent dehydrogenase (short-subunit alcohol dehydrogenase family)